MVNGFKNAVSLAASACKVSVRPTPWPRRGRICLGIAAACALSAPVWAETAPSQEAAAPNATAQDDLTPSGQWQRQLGLASDTYDASMRLNSPTTAPAWGPMADIAGLPLQRSALRLGDAGWYAYVNLAPSLPARIRQLLGKPEGGLTLEPRAGQVQPTRMTMGSVLRWNMGQTGQMALRLRAGRIGLTYGTRFNL